MTEKLKRVKTRYGGKCAKCAREIKQGWEVGFNPDTKQVFCKPCADAIDSGMLNAETVEPENLQEQAKLDDLKYRIDLIGETINKQNALLAEIVKLLTDADIKAEPEKPAKKKK